MTVRIEDCKNRIAVQLFRTTKTLVWVYKYFAYRPIFFYFRAKIGV